MKETSSENTTQRLALKVDALELERLNRVVAQALERQRRQGGKLLEKRPRRCIRCRKWYLPRRPTTKFCSNPCKASNYGKSSTPEYTCWKHMIGRCTRKSHEDYARYGGRGISVCKRWFKFENFFSDMGKRPTSKHTLERINNDGNYTPNNCKWATRREQANNKRSSIFVEYKGVRMTLTQWASFLGFRRGFIQSRMLRGWSFKKAITEPSRKTSLWKTKD